VEVKSPSKVVKQNELVHKLNRSLGGQNMIRTFDEVIQKVKSQNMKTVAVAVAQDEVFPYM